MMSSSTSRGGFDSRRSWVVAAACFFVQVLTFGLTEAAGLLFVATIPRYSTSREKASLPYTVAYCMRSAMGPVIGYIGRRFGIRLVTLIGCILSAVSVAACFFANDIVELIVIWGIIFGFSLGLETSLLNVILNEHFAKHLVKANGLNTSGASLGTLLLSPIIEHCVETYGLSGTFLIISGLMLNSIPAALVMILNKPDNVAQKSSDTCVRNGTNIVNSSLPITCVNDGKVKLFTSYGAVEGKIQNCDLGVLTGEGRPDLPESISKSSVILDILQLKTIRSSCAFIPPKNADIIPRFWKYKRYSIANVSNLNEFSTKNKISNRDGDNRSYSTPTISQVSEKSSQNNFSIKSPYQCDKSQISCECLPVKPTQSKWQLHRLYCEPIYVVIVIGSGVYYFIITTFLTIIVDYATDLGISLTYSTYIVMWIAFCDIFGYLFQSWIIELGHLSQSQFAALSFFCLCLASSAMVWCSHFIVLLILICIFEVAQCGVIILTAPLVSEYMDADLHATGIASVTILSSPMTLAISPLIGFFRDGGGSYAGVFYVLSATSFLCSLLFLCIPQLERRRNKHIPQK